MGACLSAAYGEEYAAPASRPADGEDGGATPMHAAALEGDVKRILAIGEQDDKLGWSGRSIKAVNHNGSTPLALAAYKGHVAAARALLALGAAVGEPNSKGLTPLHLAASQGHGPAVQALIVAGAPLDAKDAEGWTALHCAAGAGKVDICDLLVEAGASLEEPSFIGRTPLAVAAHAGEEEAVRVLIALGANVKAADNDGAFALHLAGRPWKGQEGTMAALLSAGAEVDATDRKGQTALHYAARWGNSPAIKALMAGGADAGFVDQQGHTPLDEALEAGHQGAVESLLPPEDKATDPPPAVAVGPANGVVAAAGPSAQELNTIHTTPSAPELVMDEAGPSGSGGGQAGPSGSASQLDPASQLCVICFDAPRQTVLVPCGHRALCIKCSEGQRRSRHCPICRQPVLSCVRVYEA